MVMSGDYAFDYGTAYVSDLQISKMERSKSGKVTLRELEMDGRKVEPTRRFWRSFFTRFGIADNVFRYFEPNEVFERISTRSKDDGFRFCVQQGNGNHTDRLLAVTNLNRPVIRYDAIRELLDKHGGDDLKYHDGLVTSTHYPQGHSRRFRIGGDEFQDRFNMETPVDGFGHPRFFLSLLRTVCSNGAVGYARAFRSDIPVGKNMEHCIGRALDSFDNGDGYVALRQRFESAQCSWASVRECLLMNTLIERLEEKQKLTSRGMAAKFRHLAGNLAEIYGLANLEALSDKRRRILPAKCRVYDLINFASELATHHAVPEGAQRLQAFIGSLISDEYDLEGTADTAAEFDAFFVEGSQAAGAQNMEVVLS